MVTVVAVALEVVVPSQNTLASVSLEAATTGAEAVTLYFLEVSIVLTAAVNPPTAVVSSATV